MKLFNARRISLVFSVVLSTGIALADDPDTPTRCDRYAQSSVGQQLENTTRACGLTGPAWSSDYNYHFDWCMHGENSAWKVLHRERDARRGALHRCGPAASEFGCEAYARIAVIHNDENLIFGCGFAGPRWSSDYQYHYDWCQHGENLLRSAAGEGLERKSALEPCRRR